MPESESATSAQQTAIRLGGNVKGVSVKIEQWAGKKVATDQKGVVLSGSNQSIVSSKAEMTQSAEGEVVARDRVININSG